MKLLLVPDPTSPNGEDAFCREIARRAAKRGHETRIQAVPEGPREEVVARLSAAGFARDVDAVVVNALQAAPFLAARAAGKKTVVRLIDCATGVVRADEEARRLVPQADLVLVPSQYLAEIVKGWGGNGSVKRAPYAYDRVMAQQIALVTMRAARPSGFMVVAAGDLSEEARPGYEALVSAVARLRLDCHLTVIGTGPALPALKERALRLAAADRIAFLGAQPHTKTMEYLRSARAYVDPAGTTGFPTMALYAMSEGCPVVAARSGAVPEFVLDGKNGLLVPPGDAHALSEAIVTLYSVRGLSLQLIAEGVKTVERHSWDATVEAVFNALESI